MLESDKWYGGNSYLLPAYITEYNVVREFERLYSTIRD